MPILACDLEDVLSFRFVQPLGVLSYLKILTILLKTKLILTHREYILSAMNQALPHTENLIASGFGGGAAKTNGAALNLTRRFWLK